MSNLIPTIHQAGVFVLNAPFKLVPDTIYECAALADFSTLTLSGVNVYQVYYEPYSISKSTYEADVKNGVVIVTLSTMTQPTVVLPSSFIKSLPLDNLVPFNLFIASACITVPDNTEFDIIKAAMADTIAAHFGVSDPEIVINQVPTRKYMTKEDAKLVEQNRIAGITDRGTLRTENSRLVDLVKTLQEQNTALVDYINNNK